MHILHLEFNLAIGLYSELILIIVLYAVLNRGKGNRNNSSGNKYFIALVVTNILHLIVDFMARIDGAYNTSFSVSYLANIGLYFLNPILMIFCCLYICEQIDMTKQEKNRVRIIYMMIFLVNTVLVILTPMNHLLFYFDEQHTYRRGAWSFVPYVALFLITIYTEYILIRHRKTVERSHFLFLTLFGIIPVVAAVLQAFIYGYAFALNAHAFAVLLVFIYVQNRNLDTDYLTGVYNRRKLDNHIQNKIEASTATHTFAAILVDINHFKAINDMLGHQAGDVALVEAANLLRSALRIDTFIARYGGDEFCAVIDVDCLDDLHEIMNRIRKWTDDFNNKKGKAFQLSFSMGGSLYSKIDNSTPMEFLSHIDALMYEDKRRCKEKNHEDTGVYGYRGRRETD